MRRAGSRGGRPCRRRSHLATLRRLSHGRRRRRDPRHAGRPRPRRPVAGRPGHRSPGARPRGRCRRRCLHGGSPRAGPPRRGGARHARRARHARVYATPADQLPLAGVAPGLLSALRERGSLLAAVAATRAAGPTVEQPVGGMFRLVAELERRVRGAGGDVRCGASVETLTRDASGAVLTTADGESLRADRVVVATPAAAATRLLAQVGADVEAPAVRRARFAVLAVDGSELAAEPVGSGVLVAERTPELRAQAMTHYSAKWPWARVGGREVLRLSYPADLEPTAEQAIADASLLSGVTISPRQVAAFASVEWTAMPARIDPAARDRLLAAARQAGVDLVGAWVDGNGIAPVILGVDRVLR
nr:FAD-dependent oxidoreductase [Tessaracoccus defluvii]